MLSLMGSLVRFSAGATPAPGTESVSGVLNMATEILTWAISAMTSVISFIVSHPLILIYFGLAIVGFGVGLFFRIWRSA